MSEGNYSIPHGRCYCDGHRNVTLNTPDSSCDSFCSGEILYKSAAIVLQISYAIVLLVGLLGNLLTCVLIKLRKSMRRSIHIYTFNLAVCDCLILIFYVPSQMVFIENQLNWVMGVTVCKVNNIILPASLAATVFTLLSITIDRARGLLQPFVWRSDSQRYAKISIPIIWVVSTLLSLPMLIYPTVSHTSLDGLDVLTCREMWPDENVGNIYWIAMFALLFVIPLILIFILHVIMVVVISKEKNIINQKQNRKMIKMTIAVVTVFLICTGMQHTYFLVMVYGNVSDIRFGAFFFCASNFVVSVQAALNPIIYGTFRQDFNKGFKGLICKLMKLLKLLNNSPYLCHHINYHEYQMYEEDTLRHVTDFDHYFRSRKSCLADQIAGNVTDLGLYSMVEGNMEENGGSMLENNNDMLNQMKNIRLEENETADLPISSSSFYLLSKEFLNRLSYYMEGSKETEL